MKRTIRNGFALSAAAVALAVSLPACGTQGNEPTGSLSTSSADWTRGNPDPNRLPHALPQQFPTRIADCSPAEYVGILAAFNTGQINAAQLALSVSQNVDVRAFAQQMLVDEQNLAARLSAFLTLATVTPVESQIATDITLTSQAWQAQLRSDENFDRDFVVGEIGAHWMLSGFFQTMALPPEQLGEIVGSAMHAVQVHLNIAFQVESKLVGMCGVAPAVVVTPDAGSPSDCGCPSGGEDGGSCNASSGR